MGKRLQRVFGAITCQYWLTCNFNQKGRSLIVSLKVSLYINRSLIVEHSFGLQIELCVREEKERKKEDKKERRKEGKKEGRKQRKKNNNNSEIEIFMFDFVNSE